MHPRRAAAFAEAAEKLLKAPWPATSENSRGRGGGGMFSRLAFFVAAAYTTSLVLLGGPGSLCFRITVGFQLKGVPSWLEGWRPNFWHAKQDGFLPGTCYTF